MTDKTCYTPPESPARTTVAWETKQGGCASGPNEHCTAWLTVDTTYPISYAVRQLCQAVRHATAHLAASGYPCVCSSCAVRQASIHTTNPVSSATPDGRNRVVIPLRTAFPLWPGDAVIIAKPWWPKWKRSKLPTRQPGRLAKGARNPDSTVITEGTPNG